jgi:hypothetical protein
MFRHLSFLARRSGCRGGDWIVAQHGQQIGRFDYQMGLNCR